MDSFCVNKLKEILLIIDDLGLEDETTFHTSPQNKTKRRGRKSHVPPVTTVPRKTRGLSGDRQAHQNSRAEQDGKEAPPHSPRVTASPPSAEADSGQTRRAPNNKLR